MSASVDEAGGRLTGDALSDALGKLWAKDWTAALSAGRGTYLGADAALDDEDEHCAWCQRGGEMLSFEGRPFCGEYCANSWWYEWGHDD